MARGTTFAELETQLRDELGRTTEAGLRSGDRSSIRQKLRRVYESLEASYAWPFLRKTERISLSAGQRFYDPPPNINLDRIEEIKVWYGDNPQDISRGIGSRQYASFDSASDERSDPTLAWDIRWDGDGDTGTAQIEVWPIPASDSMFLEIKGVQAISRLVDDDDVCLLDDNLVVLVTAAQMLKGQKSDDAEDVASSAATLYGKLTGNIAESGRRRYRLGVGSENHASSRARAIVRVR